MKKKILIFFSYYYKELTINLIKDAKKKLKTVKADIDIIKVPGTFEIPVIISKKIKVLYF